LPWDEESDMKTVSAGIFLYQVTACHRKWGRTEVIVDLYI